MEQIKKYLIGLKKIQKIERDNMKNNREKTVIRTSVISIIGNIILAGFKAAVGLIANSVAIISDAINNLSDALSSIITIFVLSIWLLLFVFWLLLFIVLITSKLILDNKV